MILFILTGLLFVGVGLFTATMLGAKQLSFTTVIRAIFQYQDELDLMLVRDLRLPRAIASMLVGGMLALSGAAMQGITRNPVAEPTILGMSQGATLAVTIATVSLGIAGSGKVLFAMLGALVSGGLLLLISIKSKISMNIAKLLLAGTAASMFFLSMASTIALLGNKSQELAFWVAGGFGNAKWSDIKLLVLFGGICSLGLFLMAGRINLLSLGEEVAIGLGIDPSKLRMIVIVMLIFICGACVSVSGNIVFIGLVVPHVVRKIVGSDYRVLMPISFLYGSALLIWADVLAKMVNLPYETPIGLFTAMLGVPFFLWLVRKEKG